MAKAPEKQEGDDAPPKKKGKLMLFVIIGVVVVVLAGGGAAFFLLKKKSTDEADAEGDGGPGTRKEAKADKGHPAKPPTYVKLEQFTTNLMPETPDQPGQYIQVVVELRLAEETAADIVKGYMPELRDKILRLLSSRKPSQLATLEGKDALASEIRSTVNNLVSPGSAKKGKGGKEADADGVVESVHFSSFIIQ